MVPVGHSRSNYAIQIRQYKVHGLSFVRWAGWHGILDLSRTDLGKNRVALRMGEIISDPVDYLIAIFPKLFGIHVAEGGGADWIGRRRPESAFGHPLFLICSLFWHYRTSVEAYALGINYIRMRGPVLRSRPCA